MEYNITRKERDCIVALHENSGFPLRLFNIAEILKIKAPTAYELVKRLESKNIIEKKIGCTWMSFAIPLIDFSSSSAYYFPVKLQ